MFLIIFVHIYNVKKKKKNPSVIFEQLDYGHKIHLYWGGLWNLLHHSLFLWFVGWTFYYSSKGLTEYRIQW